MAGSDRQLSWTTVILYSMKVTKEHAFHHPFSGLGDQHPLKASRNNSMLESTNSSLFSEGQDTNCIFTIINITESFPVCGSSLVYLCISLLRVELKTRSPAFSCDFIELGPSQGLFCVHEYSTFIPRVMDWQTRKQCSKICPLQIIVCREVVFLARDSQKNLCIIYVNDINTEVFFLEWSPHGRST